jgi:hypothetical protein
MTYKPEVVVETLQRMKESEYGFNMKHWHQTPEGEVMSAIRGVTNPHGYCYTYKPAPPGSTFCFAGFLAMFEVERLFKASKSGVINIGSGSTETLALNSIGLGHNIDSFDEEQYDIQDAIDSQFRRLFFRKTIRTVGGLQRVLKKEGLLQLV